MKTILCCLLLVPGEWARRAIVYRLFGLHGPVLDSVERIRANWKFLRGRKVIDQEIDVVHGYMYTRVKFDDGTSVLIRGD